MPLRGPFNSALPSPVCASLQVMLTEAGILYQLKFGRHSTPCEPRGSQGKSVGMKHLITDPKHRALSLCQALISQTGSAASWFGSGRRFEESSTLPSDSGMFIRSRLRHGSLFSRAFWGGITYDESPGRIILRVSFVCSFSPFIPFLTSFSLPLVSGFILPC
ncbi:hypothetical protein BCR34DRAFT_324096 [Clohesyomyces aquaticus]|uniref:Uncharacterized protein n=1 Tax=Clohesyomyces aquaticus TaxID=1231657 RepID=A0A1Y1ZMM6_9PLEO|nr:hypothetical protein BCR34DRAFT_324096 [Clohesyomyces aquaticus]